MNGRSVNTDGLTALLVTIEEAARRLAIGRSHVYAQIQSGNLRSVRIGRSRRILESDLGAFIEALLGPPERNGLPRSQAANVTPVKNLPRRSGRR